MSKIICDICGTTYPETASQCPICGSAKSADSGIVTGDANIPTEETSSTYQYVKGGRFSKRNVIKRNKKGLNRQEKVTAPQDEESNEESGNKAIVIVLFILLAAIISVVIYIALRFFTPGGLPDNTVPTDPSGSTSTTAPSTEPSTAPTTAPTTQPTTAPTTEPTTEPTTAPTTEPRYPCTGLSVRNPKILLDELGATEQLSISTSPANTTDILVFVSDNVSVATVSAEGVVTAIGEGTAQITITCGLFEVHCNVEVALAATEPTTDPTTEPTTEPPTEPDPVLELNRSDITFFGPGESWQLYSGTLPLTKIQWYSNNENVATISNGTVTAVGAGMTTVYGIYDGVEVSCVIRCNWEAFEYPTEPTTEPTEPETQPTTEPTEPDGGDNIEYTLLVDGFVPAWGNDITLRIGESVVLTLVDPSGETVYVNWVADASGYISIDGGRITGVAPISNLMISANCNGQTIYCTIRVSSI